MKRFLLLHVCGAFFLLPVHSQSQLMNVGLEVRTDFDAWMNNRHPDTRSFRLNTLQLVFSGELYPGITYRVQQRLNDTPFRESDRYMANTLDAFVNFAPRHWNWDFTIGKQNLLFGTYETDYDPSDLYLLSLVFDNFLISQVGVTARRNWKNGSLAAQVSDVTGDQLVYNENRSFAYTLNAAGYTPNSKMNASIAYTLIQAGNKHFFNWLTLGAQLRHRNYFGELDAYAGRYRENMSLDEETDNYIVADNLSVSITSRLRLGKLSPLLKLSFDYQQDAQEKTMSKRRWSGATGMEYYPLRKHDLRFHAIYQFNYVSYGEMWYNNYHHEMTNRVTIGMRWQVSLGDLFETLRK